ncbi:hypothetical protein CC86DRAFT_385912 [Ophiobolus disseminans]|uniref:Uncharacterized protein n=1 Tax=Ophiobolus disseminans TaxID=1469910 RepID=A0A6A6ZMD0_9PLEO|nr:hypothetical protein CC86DRAFT_385912 [Ophiobolus disseminans]
MIRTLENPIRCGGFLGVTPADHSRYAARRGDPRPTACGDRGVGARLPSDGSVVPLEGVYGHVDLILHGDVIIVFSAPLPIAASEARQPSQMRAQTQQPSSSQSQSQSSSSSSSQQGGSTSSRVRSAPSNASSATLTTLVTSFLEETFNPSVANLPTSEALRLDTTEASFVPQHYHQQWQFGYEGSDDTSTASYRLILEHRTST